ncbi:MAG: nucleotidyl transferase AbiEii/AbiGii toxin family protein [Cyclobacteriaceae bacterium]|nr:nucleotidyl transferase AbiEii/AbiGii toxin family protein [Cyclobacteriaceae bacterium]
MLNDAIKNARLVGGTALALHIGHRKSIDLDLFGELNMDVFNTGYPFGNDVQAVNIRNTQNIKIFIINNIKVDIVNYTYPWLEDQYMEDDIRLATLSDISAMKLAAVTGRGTKKDFIDISFLLDSISLKNMMANYLKKYHDGSEFMVLKSLTYFADAENDPMPNMLSQRSWQETKNIILKAVKDFTSSYKC